MIRPFFLVFVCSLALNTVYTQEIDYKGFPEWSWHKLDSTEYYLYTPVKLESGGKYPVALFLHGCCGQDAHATLRNTVDPPVRMWHQFGANKQEIPTYIIAPKTTRGWSQHLETLKKVIDGLIENQQADPQRIYITGFSMGGAGTWEFLQRYPRYFAAAIPMGMNFQGDPEIVKNIPIWAHKGETDWFARDLNKQVSVMRSLNGDRWFLDANWQTGVNPRFTEFTGIGHGVQWIASSRQNLVDWAYSKVNDGNIYPVVFFKSPRYLQEYQEGEEVTVELAANDPDGTITRVDFLLNGQLISSRQQGPFHTSFRAPPGDSKLEAIAHDNQGKTSTATSAIRVDLKTRLITNRLPYARQGAFYEKRIWASGNGAIQFALTHPEKIPVGLTFSSGGQLSGIPEEYGNFVIGIEAVDEDGDSARIICEFEIKPKRAHNILVKNIKNHLGDNFPAAKIKIGASLWKNSDGEINFSEPGKYAGLTFIQGDAYDTAHVAKYLTFEVEEPVRVYVAYEKKDLLFQSTIPEWLQAFTKEEGEQMVAQYFYYDVYSKDFPPGTVSLPDAYEKENGVSTNYVVMVDALSNHLRFSEPEINSLNLSTGIAGVFYRDQLTCHHAVGELTWKITGGHLPVGLNLTTDGLLTGIARKPGKHYLSISVTDQYTGLTGQERVMIEIK